MQCLFALSEAQRSRRCGEKHMSETVTGYIDHVIFRKDVYKRQIEYMEEPMVNAEIMVTTEFIGAIMDLCQERRGQYLGCLLYTSCNIITWQRSCFAADNLL